MYRGRGEMAESDTSKLISLFCARERCMLNLELNEINDHGLTTPVSLPTPSYTQKMQRHLEPRWSEKAPLGSQKKLETQEDKITNIYDPVNFRDPDLLSDPSDNPFAHAWLLVHRPPT